jgi:hypothetical protein
MAVQDTQFDTNADATLVAAQGAGTYIKVLAISMHNNDTTETNDVKVRLKDGSGGSDFYGGSNGSIYLPGRGGVFQLPLVYSNGSPVPWFTLSANTALYADLSAARYVSGTVWWTID